MLNSGLGGNGSSGGSASGGSGSMPSSLADKYLHKKFKRAFPLSFSGGGGNLTPDETMSTTSSVRSDTESLAGFSAIGSENDSRRVPSYGPSPTNIESQPSPRSTPATMPWNRNMVNGSEFSERHMDSKWLNHRYTHADPLTIAAAAAGPPPNVSADTMLSLIRVQQQHVDQMRAQFELRQRFEQNNHRLHPHHPRHNVAHHAAVASTPNPLHLQQRQPPNPYAPIAFGGQKQRIRRASDDEEEVVVVDEITDDDRQGNAAIELYRKTMAASVAAAPHKEPAAKSLYQQSIMMRQQQQHLHQNHVNLNHNNLNMTTNKTVGSGFVGRESPFSGATSGRSSADTTMGNQPILISSSSSTEDIHMQLQGQQRSKSPSKTASSTVKHATTDNIGKMTGSSSPATGKHVCPYCQLNCSKPSVLRKHIRAHTNERPYPCKPCGFAFKTRSNLYKHFRYANNIVYLNNIIHNHNSHVTPFQLLFIDHDHMHYGKVVNYHLMANHCSHSTAMMDHKGAFLIPSMN